MAYLSETFGAPPVAFEIIDRNVDGLPTFELAHALYKLFSIKGICKDTSIRHPKQIHMNKFLN